MENKVMAVVNGKEIFESDVDRFIELMGNRAVPFKNEKGKQTLCEEIIKQELIHIDALDRKMNEKEDFVREMEEIKRSILAKYYLNDLFANLEVSDEEIKAYYEENKNLFVSKYSFHAKHILVENEEKANELKKAYDAGSSFEDLATEHSLCPSKEVGGDLGEFSQGQMVLEFENACIEAKVNEVTDPIKTQFGYHLIKLESKTEPKELEFEAVVEEIRATLLKEKEKTTYVERLDSLMKKATIERNY